MNINPAELKSDFPQSETENLKMKLSESRTEGEVSIVYERVIKQWKELLKDKPFLSDLASHISSEYCLTISSVNVMIAWLKAKQGYENIHCYTCKDLESLQVSLEKLGASEFEGKIAFLVRSGQFRVYPGTALHISPVLIEKSGDSIKIMVMDSVKTHQVVTPIGSEMYDVRKDIILNTGCEALRELYPMNVYVAIKNAQIPQARVYVISCQRQRDFYSCAVFALNDLKHFFDREYFFEEIESKGRIEPVEEDKQLFFVHNLPPEHMKLTQSLCQIAEYHNDDRNKSWEKLRNKDWSLERSVNKSARESSECSTTTERINMKAADRHFKYLHRIHDLGKTLTAAEMKEIAERYDCSKIQFNGLKD